MIDFETYSEAGYIWGGSKWLAPPRASQNRKGLPVVGLVNYARHPTTEVLCMAYWGKVWKPGDPPPVDLFLHIVKGGLVEAWNSSFEYVIWNEVCTRRYGWPPLPASQVRCAMARARAYSLPGSLEKVGAVLALAEQKTVGGGDIVKRYCMPRNATKADPRLRIPPEPELYEYCLQDVVAEVAASAVIPHLDGEELEYWQCDQRINRRGVQVDVEAVQAICEVIAQAEARYYVEIVAITGGIGFAEVAALARWAGVESLDEENMESHLKNPLLLPPVRRALEIRAIMSSASVKKVFSMRLRATPEGRLNDLYIYHGARTGRATGEGPQPTNLPNSGPDVWHCDCGAYFGLRKIACPECGESPIGDIPF